MAVKGGCITFRESSFCISPAVRKTGQTACQERIARDAEQRTNASESVTAPLRAGRLDSLP